MVHLQFVWLHFLVCFYVIDSVLQWRNDALICIHWFWIRRRLLAAEFEPQILWSLASAHSSTWQGRTVCYENKLSTALFTVVACTFCTLFRYLWGRMTDTAPGRVRDWRIQWQKSSFVKNKNKNLKLHIWSSWSWCLMCVLKRSWMFAWYNTRQNVSTCLCNLCLVFLIRIKGARITDGASIYHQKLQPLKPKCSCLFHCLTKKVARAVCIMSQLVDRLLSICILDPPPQQQTKNARMERHTNWTSSKVLKHLFPCKFHIIMLGWNNTVPKTKEMYTTAKQIQGSTVIYLQVCRQEVWPALIQ